MDDDPVDQRIEVEENCKPQCSKNWETYLACSKRVQDGNIKEGSAGNCQAQYFDWLHCIDKCVSKKLFRQLK